jgi:hypothetical protein
MSRTPHCHDELVFEKLPETGPGLTVMQLFDLCPWASKSSIRTNLRSLQLAGRITCVAPKMLGSAARYHREAPDVVSPPVIDSPAGRPPSVSRASILGVLPMANGVGIGVQQIHESIKCGTLSAVRRRIRDLLRAKLIVQVHTLPGAMCRYHLAPTESIEV